MNYKTCKYFAVRQCKNCKLNKYKCNIIQVIDAILESDNVRFTLKEIIQNPFIWDPFAIQQLPKDLQDLYEKLSLLK
jgi:hypothetical protein